MVDETRRFQNLQRLAKKKEDDAAAVLAGARRERDAARQRLHELEAYRSEYLQGHARVSATGSSARLRDFQIFIDRLDQAIAVQRQVLDEQEQRYRQARDAWSRRHTRTRAIGNVVEHKQAEARVREARREQRQTDDRARRRS